MGDYTDFNYSEVFEKFNGKNILIIGDVMIDTYLIGKVDRISPEAPVPICDVERKEYKLGGASNVAISIKELGAVPLIFSTIGDDDIGKIFMDLLEKNDMYKEGIVKSKIRKTTNKMRIIGNNCQMLRVDEETKEFLDISSYLEMIKKLEIIIKKIKIDGIIFEDYDKGIINRVLIDRIIDMCKGIPIYVDPKYKNFNLYHDIRLFKPNLNEFKDGLKLDWGNDGIDEVVKRNCKILHEERNIEKIMVTMADRGMFVSVKDGESFHLKTKPRNIVDVSGAGDAVIALATLMDIEGCDISYTSFISNIAGGLVCEEIGVVPVNKYKTLREVDFVN